MDFWTKRYVIATLADGTIIEGMVVKVGNGHIVLDECLAFGDWVFIEICNIVSFNSLS